MHLDVNAGGSYSTSIAIALKIYTCALIPNHKRARENFELHPPKINDATVSIASVRPRLTFKEVIRKDGWELASSVFTPRPKERRQREEKELSLSLRNWTDTY